MSPFRIVAFAISVLAMPWICLAALRQPAPERASPDWGTCAAHPANIPGVVPVLLKQWNFKQRSPSGYTFQPSLYIPRMKEPFYAPAEDNASPNKFKGYDFFYYVWDPAAGIETDTVQLTLHREARVCLLLPAFKPFYNPKLHGYKSEGWARLIGNSNLMYGFHKDRTVGLRGSVYVFCRAVGTSATLPSPKWVKANVRGLPSSESRYMVLLSERDGTASQEPRVPNGMLISPGEPCPKELHDMWVTKSDDPNDAEIAGMKFPTWHPLWDPCYWCTYGHEHGSNAPAITGIKPLYSYPSFKNGREYEQHEGHKTLVLDVGNYYFTYQVHSDLATQHRFFARFHSGGFYITDKRSGELIARVINKIDFGTIQASVGGFENDDGQEINSRRIYLRPDVAAAIERNMQGVSDRNIRVNVINGNVRSRLDPRYTYHRGNLVMMGLYEVWRAAMQCANTNDPRHRFMLDVRDPSTALKSATATSSDPPTYLFAPQNPRGRDNVIPMYQRQTSTARRMVMQYVTFAYDLCPHGGQTDGGVWYTDPKGYHGFNAPGPNRMFQYMKPGFSLTLAGNEFITYEVYDTWRGLYTLGTRGKGRFQNPGSGIDYEVN